MEIKAFDSDLIQINLPQLSELLCAVVADGASIGFLPPLSTADAEQYWREIRDQVFGAKKIMLVAVENGRIAGSVQLRFEPLPNARHRAEVQKLLVHPECRRQGIGSLLMDAIEKAAGVVGRTLLVLDTLVGNGAATLYRERGYIEVGQIPGYTREVDGQPGDTIVFYRSI